MKTAAEKKHITATPDICGGKPRIEGTRIRVQDIYVWHELQGQLPEQIVATFPHLTLANVYAALAYFFDHKDQILRDIREDVESVDMIKAQMGAAAIEIVRGSEAGHGPVSS